MPKYKKSITLTRHKDGSLIGEFVVCGEFFLDEGIYNSHEPASIKFTGSFMEMLKEVAPDQWDELNRSVEKDLEEKYSEYGRSLAKELDEIDAYENNHD